MGPFVGVALSFPSVVYTVLLGASLLYWVFVMIGAARVDLLGDGAADGALDGLDGHVGHAGDGAGEAAGHAFEGSDHHGSPDLGDGEAGELTSDHHGALAGMMAALKLRAAPATVVLSLVVLFAWLFSVLGMQAAQAWLPAGALGLARFAVFVLAPLLALLPTSLIVRPLAPLFAPPKAAGHQDLVGKVCTIRTGTVTARFGEATLEDGAAGVVVRVRVDTEDGALKRGDRAVIVDYDEEHQEFTVARVDDELLAEASSRPRGERRRR